MDLLQGPLLAAPASEYPSLMQRPLVRSRSAQSRTPTLHATSFVLPPPFCGAGGRRRVVPSMLTLDASSGAGLTDGRFVSGSFLPYTGTTCRYFSRSKTKHQSSDVHTCSAVWPCIMRTFYNSIWDYTAFAGGYRAMESVFVGSTGGGPRSRVSAVRAAPYCLV